MRSPESPSSGAPSAPSRPPFAVLIAIALALLTVVAGCTGVPSSSGNPTSAETTAPTTTATETSASSTSVSSDQPTEPHTAKGTSHVGTHLTVDAIADDLTVEIRLYEGGPGGTPALNETYTWDSGDEVDLTETVHELDPAYAEIVVNGTQVWNGTIYEYELYRVSVNETAASVEYSVV